MAENFSLEGLDYLIGIFPKNGTNAATTALGLFTGASQTTVPATSATLFNYTGVAEAAPTSYARQSIAAASWGVNAAGSGAAAGGRQAAAGQVSFPAAGAAYPTQINGFFLCNNVTHTGSQATEVGVFYANFDDGTGIASLALGDIVKVTPTYGLTP